MQIVVSIAILIVAVIHLLPLAGVIGPERLQMLYGIAVEEPNLQILLRHRAVLFGIIGGFLAISAWIPVYQPPALVIGIVSVLSFMILVSTVGGQNDQLQRVFNVDLVALVCLVVGAAAWIYQRVAVG